MATQFSNQEWARTLDLFDRRAEDFGLPHRRRKSVVIGSFNIREFSSLTGRSAGARRLLVEICRRFDLLAVQEVADDLSGVRELHTRLGSSWRVLVSDVTGVFPGASGNAERLAFLYRPSRIRRPELASDITYDRSEVVRNLFENRADFDAAWEAHEAKLDTWQRKCKAAKAAGKRKPAKPPIILPRFLTFIRQPHCASFEIVPRGDADALGFLAINAHTLYGEKSNRQERYWEFLALVKWLTIRAKKRKQLYRPNLILLGDCNLDFDDIERTKEQIDAYIKTLNKTELKSLDAATANFPLVSEHPRHGFIRTSARQEQTYDQIGIFAHDDRLPSPEDNDAAGCGGIDDYDYGVFNFTDLFAEALYEEKYSALPAAKQKYLIARCQWDVSDHMPVWFRQPIPGA